MSQKDYIAFAAMIKARKDEHDKNSMLFDVRTDELKALMEKMADIFARDNTKFKRAVFIKACGF